MLILFKRVGSPSDLLKATVKTTVMVPGYTKKDGTFVKPHQKTVLHDPDKDPYLVVSGKGSHSQQQAHKKLHANIPGFAKLPIPEQHAHILSSATNIQKKATDSAAVSMWKKNAFSGKNPTLKEWQAFLSIPDQDQKKFVSVVDSLVGNTDHLMPPDGDHLKLPDQTHAIAAEYDANKISDLKAEADKEFASGDEAGLSVSADEGTHGYPEVAAYASTLLEQLKHGKIAQEKIKELMSGVGGHYPVKATKKLMDDGGWQVATSVEQLKQVVDLAKKMQAEATASAAVSGYKKSIGEKKTPSKAQYDAFSALPNDKKTAILQELIGKHGDISEQVNAAYEKHGSEVEGNPQTPGGDIDGWIGGLPWVQALAVQSMAEGLPVPEKYSSKMTPGEKANLISTYAKLSGKMPAELQALMNGSVEFSYKPGPSKSPKVTKVSSEKISPKIKKLKEISADEVHGWLSNYLAGNIPVPQQFTGFFEKLPKANITKFTKWAGHASHAKDNEKYLLMIQSYLSAAISSLYGVYDKVLLYSGEFVSVPAAVALGMNPVTDPHMIKWAAIKFHANGGKEADAAIDSLMAGQEGPKDGDTKEGAEGTLVFHDGHWHKQEEEPAAVEHVLHNTTGGSNKFWSVSIDPKTNDITKKWGKIGTVGQSKVWHYASAAAAKKAATDWISEKLKGGYYPVNPPEKKPAPKVTSVSAVDVYPNQVASIDSWTAVGGQKGYNPGGTYRDEAGDDWYCKFPSGGDPVIRNELLATKLYAAAGIAVPDVKIIKKDGKLGIASKIITGAVASKDELLSGKATGLMSGFVADAWLANWDVVGNNPQAGKGWDNIMFKDGHAYRIDAGGAMLYGGAGGVKSKFDGKVVELETMLDTAINDRTAAVFGKISDADKAASSAKVLGVSDQTIMNLVDKFGPGTPSEKAALADTLIARKAYIAKKFSLTKEAGGLGSYVIVPPKFDPAGIATPPDFLNWHGSGKPGPATAEYKNIANQNGVNEMYKIAQSGDRATVESYLLPVFDETGEVVKHVTGLDHPSQYVRNYTQQVLNEIADMKKPQKIFIIQDGTALKAIDDDHPIVGPNDYGKYERAANYIVLGEPGIINVDSLGLEKLTYKNGKLKDSDYAKEAKYAFTKMTTMQKQALSSYTGGGYHGQNKSLWEGNPTGMAKSAKEALHTFSHSIKPGSVLSRRISLHGKGLAEVVGSFDKSDNQSGGAVGKVLQELAIGSTGTNPDFWSGNVQLKITVGPGCKGLWVGAGSGESGGSASSSGNEREILFPPDYRMLVNKVRKSYGKKDDDGFGGEKSEYIVEVLLLPTQEIKK